MVRRIAALSLVVMFTLPVAALGSAQENPFEGEIRKYEEADVLHMPAKGGIVFVGSSSIRMWSTLEKDFPNHRVLNRGFGGSQVSDSVYYADRIVTKYEPRTIVFFAGTNDLASGKNPETVAADFKAFVGKVRAKLPEVPVLYIAVSPAPSRWANRENQIRTNGLIRDYSKAEKGITFVDVWPLMLDASGNPRPELFIEDQLHMKPAGYEIWTRAIRPLLPEPDVH